MAVLGREAILQAMESGSIGVTPFDRERLGPASLDLTLARTFRVFRKVHQVIDVMSTSTSGSSPRRSRCPTASTS
ncbi:MAG: dCTP deaminase domain-containing protein [Cyanobium sp.]